MLVPVHASNRHRQGEGSAAPLQVSPFLPAASPRSVLGALPDNAIFLPITAQQALCSFSSQIVSPAALAAATGTSLKGAGS